MGYPKKTLRGGEITTKRKAPAKKGGPPTVTLQVTKSTRHSGLSIRALDGTTHTFYEALVDNFKAGDRVVMVRERDYTHLVERASSLTATVQLPPEMVTKLKKTIKEEAEKVLGGKRRTVKAFAEVGSNGNIFAFENAPDGTIRPKGSKRPGLMLIYKEKCAAGLTPVTITYEWK